MDSRGFTLIEVLIALVILSITFIWLLSAESQGIDMALRSRFLTTSTLLAQERISQVTSGVRTISTGESKGDFGEDYKGYTYEENVEATPLAGYLKYSLTVRWGGEESPLETKIISFISSF
ncbi:MAG TPA: prepilin-type N-terminal cleavage/methylation domain-containing protein [Desulfomonilia bacterium]|jgi:type II secretion system protein I|nr:prepilin-type N-terminal cleavage/methylation domain-containing protein [Thermodesulfobacteriota bacterium]HWR68358.1 prepilin-type N-terminal cleavage/methylation domain-containing protein [Desulfomonilia bacterium]